MVLEILESHVAIIEQALSRHSRERFTSTSHEELSQPHEGAG